MTDALQHSQFDSNVENPSEWFSNNLRGSGITLEWFWNPSGSGITSSGSGITPSGSGITPKWFWNHSQVVLESLPSGSGITLVVLESLGVVLDSRLIFKSLSTQIPHDSLPGYSQIGGFQITCQFCFVLHSFIIWIVIHERFPIQSQIISKWIKMLLSNLIALHWYAVSIRIYWLAQPETWLNMVCFTNQF